MKRRGRSHEQTRESPHGVPLGVAVDDRPAARPSRGARNDAPDRRRAMVIIGLMLGSVGLVTVLGSTLLRPFIVQQRAKTVVRVTADQVDLLAGIAAERYRATGVAPTAFSEIAEDERLETSGGVDLWGSPFVFEVVEEAPGERVGIGVRSAGPDGVLDTDDDLVAVRTVEWVETADDND